MEKAFNVLYALQITYFIALICMFFWIGIKYYRRKIFSAYLSVIEDGVRILSIPNHISIIKDRLEDKLKESNKIYSSYRIFSTKKLKDLKFHVNNMVNNLFENNIDEAFASSISIFTILIVYDSTVLPKNLVVYRKDTI